MNTFHTCVIILVLTSSALSAQDAPVVPPCQGADVCLNQLQNAFQIKSITKVCSALEASGGCLSALQNNCPQDDYKKVFDNAELQLNDDEVNIGCDGTCAAAAESCFADLVSATNSNDMYTQTICRKVTGSLTCLQNLNTTQCKTGIKNALYNFAKSIKAQEFSEICDANGNAVAIKMPLKLQQGQPTQKSCSERLNNCASEMLSALQESRKKSDYETICKDYLEGLKCYSFLDNNEQCRKEIKAVTGIPLSAYIKESRELTKKACDSGDAPSLTTSSALLVIGLAISVVKNYV